MPVAPIDDDPMQGSVAARGGAKADDVAYRTVLVESGANTTAPPVAPAVVDAEVVAFDCAKDAALNVSAASATKIFLFTFNPDI
jgi:hypothetical protein